MKRAKKLVTILAIAALTLSTFVPVHAEEAADSNVTVVTKASEAKNKIFSEKGYYYLGNFYLGQYPVVNGMDALNKKIEDLLFKTALYGIPPQGNYRTPKVLPISFEIAESDELAKLTVCFSLADLTGATKGGVVVATYYIDCTNLKEIDAAAFDTASTEDSEDGVVPVDEEEILMIPVRAALDPMGYDLAWDAETKTCTITLAKVEVAKLTVDKNAYPLKDKVLELSAAPVLENGSLCAPVDFYEEILGLVVQVNDDGSVLLASKPEAK